MITVYYVTASNPADSLQARRSDNDPPRLDVAKFFDKAHAETHADQLAHGSRWADVRVESRHETVAQQHPAHRATWEK